MRKITAVSFKQLMGLLFLFSQTLTAQTNEGKFSVLVAEYEENSNINLNQAVVRYDFEKGEMVRQEKLISVSKKEGARKITSALIWQQTRCIKTVMLLQEMDPLSIFKQARW